MMYEGAGMLAGKEEKVRTCIFTEVPIYVKYVLCVENYNAKSYGNSRVFHGQPTKQLHNGTINP